MAAQCKSLHTINKRLLESPFGQGFTELSSYCLHSFQSESLVALEAAKAAEKSVLDEQVRSSQETLQEKLKELSVLQQQNVKVVN